MFDSLPYRNDASLFSDAWRVSLPLLPECVGIETLAQRACRRDDGGAGLRDLPCVIVPCGVTLPPAQAEMRVRGADPRRALRARTCALPRLRSRLPALAAHREAAANSLGPPHLAGGVGGCERSMDFVAPFVANPVGGQASMFLTLRRKSARDFISLTPAGCLYAISYYRELQNQW